MRASTSGWRASRSSAQPSEPAVVSWPAASSVASWSRSCSRRSARGLEHGQQRAVLAVVAVDPLVQQRVERPHAPQVGRIRAAPSPPQAHGQQHRHRHLQRAADRVAQPRVAAAEHDAQDDLERHRLHALERPQRRARLPARQLFVSDARHRRPPARERLAVERRQHQAALLQMLLAVEHEDRARAGERLQEGRAGAGVQLVGRGGVDALDLGRVGGEDHRRVRPREPQRERLAVARLRASHQRRRPRDPLVGLERGRRARAGRERHESHHRAQGAAPLPAVRGPGPLTAGTHLRAAL